MSVDRSIQLRAQEIINANPDGITVREALKRAILERYPNDPEHIAEAFAAVGASSLSGLRKRTYELPDDQGALFEVPNVIGIRTADGDLLIQREAASLGQVRVWQTEGQQHHATQLLRFKRAGKTLDNLKDEKAALPWGNARHLLTAIEAGEVDGDDDQE